MTKHKVSELEGALLDAAVAKAEGEAPRKQLSRVSLGDDGDASANFRMAHKGYSSRWEYGGPIIERERIHIGWVDDCRDESKQWTSFCDCIDIIGLCHGPTPLIAAMRAYVASYFGGEEVELP